jgi:uncharacterized protein
MRRLLFAATIVTLGATLLIVVVGGGVFTLVHGAGADAGTQHAQITAALGVAGRLQVALNAGVVEELLFRAVLIERVLWLTDRWWIPAVVSVVLFAGSHYVTGSETLLYAAIVDGVAGVVFVALYLLRRNVVANSFAHFLADMVGVVLVPLIPL